MRRFRGRSAHRGRRSSRKTRWVESVWQGLNIAFLAGSPAMGSPYTWVSFWAKWPAGKADPLSDRLEPSDETLVRSLLRSSLTWDPGVADVYQACLGLIAFDGGEFPDFYENGIFTSNTSFVAPPHPLVEGFDDWIIRQPYFNTNFTGFSFTNPSLEDSKWTESRAMRKLPPDTGILAVLGVTNVLSLAPVIQLNWAMDCRLAVRSGYTA